MDQGLGSGPGAGSADGGTAPLAPGSPPDSTTAPAAPTVQEPTLAPETVIVETPQDQAGPDASDTRDLVSDSQSSSLVWVVPLLLLAALAVGLIGLWRSRREV